MKVFKSFPASNPIYPLQTVSTKNIEVYIFTDIISDLK